MSEWIKCSERLPEIDYTAPEYSRNVRVLTVCGKHVQEMSYVSHGFAKTERGRLPRWECGGRLAWSTPTHWQPLPLPPEV